MHSVIAGSVLCSHAILSDLLSTGFTRTLIISLWVTPKLSKNGIIRRACYHLLHEVATVRAKHEGKSIHIICGHAEQLLTYCIIGCMIPLHASVCCGMCDPPLCSASRMSRLGCKCQCWDALISLCVVVDK